MSDVVKNGEYIRVGVDGETPFTYFASPTARQKAQFVVSVTDTLVDEEHYHHVLKDVVFAYMLINVFTDVDTSEIDDAVNAIDCMEGLITETNIIEVMLPEMEDGLIEELRDAIDKNIEYRTGIRANKIEDGIARIMSAIEEKIVGFDLDGMADVAQAFSSMSGQITPEKMLEAYAKTSMFKANNKERQDIKAVKSAAAPTMMPLA